MTTDPTNSGDDSVPSTDVVTALQGILDNLSKLIKGLFRKPQPVPPDTTPPSAPTSLAVSLVSQNPTLTWTASTDNVAVAGYFIWRKTGSGGTYAQLPTPSLVTNYTDHAVTIGNTYFYKVTAYDGATPPNISGFSNEVSQAISGADVTAPTVVAQPATATINNSANPPTYNTNWPTVADINPGDGSPVSGMKDYLVYHDYPATDTLQGTVPQTGSVGSPTGFILGTNNGGSLVTGSDSGTVVTSTSSTGDTNAQHWGTADECFYSAAPVQGAGFAFIRITAATFPTPYSKAFLELRNDLSAGSPYALILYFGAQGVKGEQRLLAGVTATGGSAVADPGVTNLWFKLVWDGVPGNWTIQRQYSTTTTNGTDGTWITYDTIQMPFGTVAFIGKGADANTASVGTGGTISWTYSNYTVTGASPIVWNGVGVAGQTFNVYVKSRDNAGNVAAASTKRSMTFTAPSTATHLFPRPGAYVIAGTFQVQTMQAPADRQNCAKTKLLVYAGYANVAFSVSGITVNRQQAIDDIKSRSAGLSTNIKVFQYTDYIEVASARASALLPEWWDLINTNNWWLYRLGTSGTKVASPFAPSSDVVINPSHFCPQDGSGNYPMQRAAIHAQDFLINGVYGAANVCTSLDGLYQDVTAYFPYGTAGTIDMNRDGTADNTADLTVQSNWRIGQNNVQEKWVALTSQLAGGNFGGSYAAGQPALNPSATPNAIAPYNNNNMCVLENFFGSYNGEHAVEYYYSTAESMAVYKWTMSCLAAPQYLLFYHACNADGSDEVTPTPAWQASRHGAAFAAMDNGYWYGTQGQAGLTAARIMDIDEMHGGNLNDYNWLGAAAEAPTCPVVYSSNTYNMTTYQNGVGKREFQKGVVLMWPKGITASVTLPYPTKRLTGSQNPSINNGTAYPANTPIAPPSGTARDGLFLIKT